MNVGDYALVNERSFGVCAQFKDQRVQITRKEVGMSWFVTPEHKSEVFAFDYELSEIPEELKNEPIEVIKLYFAL